MPADSQKFHIIDDTSDCALYVTKPVKDMGAPDSHFLWTL